MDEEVSACDCNFVCCFMCNCVNNCIKTNYDETINYVRDKTLSKGEFFAK